MENNIGGSENSHDENDSVALTPAIRRAPEGKDNDSFLSEDVDKDSGTQQGFLGLYWLWFCRVLW